MEVYIYGKQFYWKKNLIIKEDTYRGTSQDFKCC